jgi:hypothetical protein
MHPNVKRGNAIHADHFRAIRENSWIADGWEVYLVNQQINLSGLRPDWVIINRSEKRAFIIDITSKYAPRHYKKGLQYVAELQQILNDRTWQVIYLEDYWLNATIH